MNNIPDKGIQQLVTSQELVVIDSSTDVNNVSTKVEAVNSSNQDFLDLNEYKTRNQDIRGLAQDVSQLHDIFQDINNLSKLQDSGINEISHSVNQANDHVQVAHVQIVQSKELQKSATVKIGVLATLVFGPLVGLVSTFKLGLLTSIASGTGTYLYDKFM